jgi:uncharacterized phage infection (PIP) family protein YhgE
LDRGADFQGQGYNLGRENLKSVIDAKAVSFTQYPTEAEARSALTDNRAYFIISVPEDFSQKVLNAKKGEGEGAMLRLILAEG